MGYRALAMIGWGCGASDLENRRRCGADAVLATLSSPM